MSSFYIKANRLELATKELKELLTEGQISKVNLKVQRMNKRYYHVIFVKKIHDVDNERYNTSAYVQLYNKRAYEKLKINVKSMNATKIILLHDPSIIGEDDLVDSLTSYQELEVTERVTRELEEKHNKEKEDLKKKIREDVLAEINEGNKNPFSNFDVEKETLPKLKEFAKLNKIDLGDIKAVEDIRAFIIDWGRKQ